MRVLLITVLSLLFFCSNCFSYPISKTGQRLSTFLDSLDVSNHWQPYSYANWLSGKSYGKANLKKVTHCSAFVAAATAKLGVYILRPPEHGLIARAQYQWLRNKGPHYGWFPVDSDYAAQRIANEGCLVVMAYDNPIKKAPGHVAIVRPSAKSKQEISWRGPQIIQAGYKNFNSANLSKGIRNHHHALKTKRLVYYGHSTPFCRLLVGKKA